MKSKIITLSLALVGLFVFTESQAQKKLTRLAPTETYPDDTYLQSATKKRAMIVVAHDDDSGAFSGTIAQLNAAGWEIVHVCLQGDDEARRTRHREAVKLIADRAEFIPISHAELRNDADTVQYAYRPIPKSRFDEVFNADLVRDYLTKTINEFDPSVIFSLDDDLGGYGHPDHVFISGMVRDLAESGVIHPDRIYQATYTPYMAEQILEVRLGAMLKKWGYPDTYEIAKVVYQVDGMPEPNVQINIQSQAEAKMNHLRGYAEAERKNLRKFIPYFEDYSAEKYFAVFDREFFRVLEF